MKVKLHPQFKLNSHQFKTTDELISFSKILSDEVSQFIINWFDKSPFLKVITSGSTGIPKEIALKKEQMINSAKATGEYFDLKENTTALLCMSPKYIAGKMMLVRAMVLGWNLDIVTSELNPLNKINKKYEFCAMVPLQVVSSLDDLHKIKTIIVGGGAISNSLKSSIQNIKTDVFATYGMTETITHIALQKLNYFDVVISSGVEKSLFTVLPSISISTDNRGCLVIDAPLICDERIITNDIVELKNETTFKWLGRFDNVINSGGIKLFPEQIEFQLAEIIDNRFFISSEPDELLGNKVVLIIESLPYSTVSLNILKEKLKTALSSYEVPKSIYYTPNFVETETKKIQRQKTLDLVLNQPKI
ncbi:MAG: AMP-binding protein [Flavobacteriaceae bacterium]|nr:AMP-binding protein [Flavobacteriaceae bacterium]